MTASVAQPAFAWWPQGLCQRAAPESAIAHKSAAAGQSAAWRYFAQRHFFSVMRVAAHRPARASCRLVPQPAYHTGSNIFGHDALQIVSLTTALSPWCTAHALLARIAGFGSAASPGQNCWLRFCSHSSFSFFAMGISQSVVECMAGSPPLLSSPSVGRSAAELWGSVPLGSIASRKGLRTSDSKGRYALKATAAAAWWAKRPAPGDRQDKATSALWFWLT